MKTWRVRVLSVALVSLATLSLVSVVGYTRLGPKWPDDEVGHLQVFVPSYDHHFSEWLFALGAWNAAGTAVHFNHQYEPEWCDIGCLSWYDDGVDWDGLCAWGVRENPEYFSWAYCYLNCYHVDDYPLNAVRSVAVHETGHSVGLGEMPTSAAVVMNWWTYTRYVVWGIYTPQGDDIDGLYDIYY